MERVWRSPFFRYGALIAGSVLVVALAFPGFVRSLLSSDEFLPHATCYLRNPQIILLHVTSDLLIGLAYVSISATLSYLVYKASKDIPFHWVFLAFGLFIVSCGLTHFMEVWTVWQSVYWLAGYVKLMTAVASVVTAVALIPLVPKIFALINAAKSSEARKSELVAAHETLRQSNQQLEQHKEELEAAYRRLENKSALLEAANEELEMFTYSVAHDLRAPLRSMQGFARLISDDHAKDLNQEAKGLTERIAASAEKMQQLLDDLLQYSRVSRGELEMNPVDVREAINAALAMVKTETEQRKAKVSVRAGEGLRVVANMTILTQVISNLISNGVKYVPPDSTAVVDIETFEEGDRIRLCIADNGIGILEAEHRRIFKLFERLHTDREYAGTGIGLAIVQRGVEKMGGKVMVKSSPGHGSTFCIELNKA